MKSWKWNVACSLALSVLLYAGIGQACQKRIFWVSPTGKDDTANIEKAFAKAVAAGSGSEVRLAPGTFYISRPIQVEDFDGTFTGTGKPKAIVKHDENGRITYVKRLSGTLIQTLGTEEKPFPLCRPPLCIWNYVFAFYFREKGGSPEDAPSVEIEDMMVVCRAPVTPIGFVDGDSTQKTYAVFQVGGRYTLDPSFFDGKYGMHAGERCFCNAEFKGVEVIGQVEPDAANIAQGYVAQPFCFVGWITDYGMDPDNNKASWNCFWQRMTGKMEVKKCRMDTFITGVIPCFIDDSEIIVTDCEAKNSPAGHAVTMVFGDFSNCRLEVSKLKTEGCSGVAFRSSHGNSTCVFRNNEINCAPDHNLAAFEMIGAPGDKLIMINNTIHSPGHFAPFGGIFSVGISDGVIAKTTITGKGLAAIYLGILGAFGESVTNWHLLGNNVENFKALPYDGYGAEWLSFLGVEPGNLRAPIWLGSGTSNCEVVGGLGYSAYVYDEGTGNEIIELEEDALEDYIEEFLDDLIY